MNLVTDYSVEIVDTAGAGNTATSGTSHVTHIGHTTAGHTSGHTAGHSTGSATCSLVDSHYDRLELAFHFLLLGLVVFGGCVRVGLEPLESLLGQILNNFLIIVGELVLELLIAELVLDLEAVGLETVLGFNLLLELLILILVALGLHDESIDFLLGETALVVGDGDLLVLAGSLVHGGHIEDTVGIDVEGDLNLRSSAGSWGDALEVELSEEVVILGHGSLSFEDLDEHTGLVVGVGGEGLGLLGGDGSVSGDQNSHDTTGGLNTLGEGSNIEHTDALDLLVLDSIEYSSLNSSTVGDGLIGVDASVELLSVEEVGDELLHLGDTGGSTDHDEVVNLSLGEGSIGESVLDGGHALSEQINAKLFELGTGKLESEVLTLGEGLALDGGGHSGGESSLGLLALGSETTESSVVSLDVDAGLLLEFSHAELDESVVEVLTAQVGVAVG